MAIRGCKTIEAYKAIRQHLVDLWFIANFEPGFFKYEVIGNAVKVTDYTGASTKVGLNEIL